MVCALGKSCACLLLLLPSANGSKQFLKNCPVQTLGRGNAIQAIYFLSLLTHCLLECASGENMT